MQNKGFKFTGKSSCFVKVENFFLAVFFFNFTLSVARYSVQSRRVPVPGTRLLIKTLLLRQRLQLEDGEIGFISGQRGGFDDARKLKTMFTKYS